MSKPTQYLGGSADFYGLKFTVDPRALIPRFETEFLVKKVIDWCLAKNPQREWRITDIGTGSGIIAIAIAVNCPKAKIWASDISTSALALAKHNAKLHNVDNQIAFLSGHLLSPVPLPLDIIVANLPYIASQSIPRLDSSVRDFEPHLALDGGQDGLDLYRQLLDQIKKLEQKPSFCIFEIDDKQANLAIEECRLRFPDVLPHMYKDSSQFNRYLTLELK